RPKYFSNIWRMNSRLSGREACSRWSEKLFWNRIESLAPSNAYGFPDIRHTPSDTRFWRTKVTKPSHSCCTLGRSSAASDTGAIAPAVSSSSALSAAAGRVGRAGFSPIDGAGAPARGSCALPVDAAPLAGIADVDEPPRPFVSSLRAFGALPPG